MGLNEIALSLIYPELFEAAEDTATVIPFPKEAVAYASLLCLHLYHVEVPCMGYVKYKDGFLEVNEATTKCSCALSNNPSISHLSSSTCCIDFKYTASHIFVSIYKYTLHCKQVNIYIMAIKQSIIVLTVQSCLSLPLAALFILLYA